MFIIYSKEIAYDLFIYAYNLTSSFHFLLSFLVPLPSGDPFLPSNHLQLSCLVCLFGLLNEFKTGLLTRTWVRDEGWRVFTGTQATYQWLHLWASFPFQSRTSLDCPGWLRTELKQYSCLSLPRGWDHNHAPLYPSLNCNLQRTLVNVEKKILSWIQYCKGLHHGKRERKKSHQECSLCDLLLQRPVGMLQVIEVRAADSAERVWARYQDDQRRD